MNNHQSWFVFLIFFCFLFSSCIKDTDFDQTENIVATPVFEVNLIHFDLDANRFYDPTTSNQILTVRDTTIIDFFDDGGVQDNLERAEFYFKFTNTIPRNFQVDFQFLSELNNTTYTTQTAVLQGAPSNAKITEFIENVEGEDILNLTLANKVVVSVTIPDSNENLQGNLNLKSKTTYYFKVVQ